MQSFRALALILLVVLAQSQAVRVETVSKSIVESYTLESGSGCAYTLVLDVREPVRRVAVLLNGTVNVTGPVEVEASGDRVVIRSPADPPWGLRAGARHIIEVNGVEAVSVVCERGAAGGGASPYREASVPPPREEGKIGGNVAVPQYNRGLNLLISLVAGAMTVVLVVVENGLARGGGRGAEERKTSNDI